MRMRTLAPLAILIASFCFLITPGFSAPEVRDPNQAQKRLPPLPTAVPADYPRDESLAAIREWLKAQQMGAAKKRMRPGDDVVAAHVMAQLLPEAEWMRLAERTAQDLSSDDESIVVNAAQMAFELEQTSFQLPALGVPLGTKVFPAAAARVRNMTPKEAKQIPFVIARLSRFADPETVIPALALVSESPDPAVRRQGVQGFMGIVLEREPPVNLSPDQRVQIAEVLLARVDDDDQRISGMAISLLGQTRPPAEKYVPRLIELLAAEKTRFAALRALGEYGPQAGSAAPALARLLDAADTRTLQQTCFALKGIGPGAKDAVPELIKLLDNTNEYVRKAAAAALGAIGPSASDALAKLDALAAEKTPTAGEFKRAAEAIRGVPGPK